jgi:5'-nucleotidase
MPLRPILAALAALALIGAPAQAFTLDVLHFNDFHSRVESINAFDSTCSDEDEAAGACFGGAARLKAAIDAARAEIAGADGNAIVLVAGDVFQGSLFFTTGQGAVEAEMLDRMGPDAMVYGNHEFDLGPEPLARFVEAVEFPVLSGSVDVSGDNMLAPLAEDQVVLEVGGERVAILGATTPDTAEISTPGPTVSFRDPVEYLAEQVEAVRAEGIDKVILLSHLGVADDVAVAEAVPGIDLIVGGHDHMLFANDGEAMHAYPLMVAGPDGGQVPIVQAGAYSKHLGRITLEFDEAGVVTSATGAARLLDKSVTPDPEILARIEALAAPIEELKTRKVAEVASDIDGSRESCRARECPMGNLVADAMLDRVKGQGVTIALQNGGGLRASIGAGEVSMGDVLAVLPFQNTLSTFNIAGAGIVAALENGVSQVEEGAGRFPQVAGVRFSWDPKVAPNEGRIRSVEVREGDGWVPIDPEKVYIVATNNFMRNGGDGYTVLRDQGTNAYDFGPGLEEVLAAYLAEHPDYPVAPQGRITRLE